MNCSDEQNLVAYADGELDAAERGAVERHLATCAACSAYVADMRGITSLGRASVARLGVPPRAPMRLENRVASRRFIISTLAATAAAAAVVLLATMISVRLLSRPNDGVVVGVKPTTTVATTTTTSPANALPVSARPSSNDELFERWAAGVRQSPVRLVPMEAVANYRPPVERPVTAADLNPRG
jgi:anti-sigma factor RsiW